MARSQAQLLRQLDTVARQAVQGTLVEVMLRCGTPSCGCHQDPARRHGPHLYLKFKTADGRSTSLYIPRIHERDARRAVEAWARMWEITLSLGQRNRADLAKRLRRKAR
jgi:hypothetical protein